MAVELRPATAERELVLSLYRKMVEIRKFDLRVLELFREGYVRGSTHAYVGQEAVAVGVCSALRDDDFITSTHRGHGHCIAKGGRLDLMMAELLGRADGYCKGKGGSMHIADVERGILGANGIVGGSIGIATGSALSARLRGTDQVTVCFFGDGGFNQGALYENANMAAIWKLPVIYVCENNQYAMSMPASVATSVPDLSTRAIAWGIPGVNVDGMDVLAVREATLAMVERARAGEGPSLLVANTYRFEGHNVGDPQPYRTREEVNAWRQKDPIPRLREVALARGLTTAEELQRIEEQVERDLEAAVEFAKASPEPPLEWLMEDIYA